MKKNGNFYINQTASSKEEEEVEWGDMEKNNASNFGLTETEREREREWERERARVNILC